MQNAPRETAYFKELASVLSRWLERQANSLDEAAREQLYERLAPRLLVIDGCLAQGDPREAEQLLQKLLVDLQLVGGTRSVSPVQATDWSRGEPMGNGRGQTQTGGRLSALLAKFRPREKAPPLDSYPTVSVPRSVLHKSVFTMDVAAQAQSGGTDGSQKLSLARESADDPVDVELTLELPAGSALTARGPLSAVLRICPDGRAAKICFELYASEVGSHSVAVVFRYEGVERLRIKRAIKVTAVPQPAEPPAPQVTLSLGIDTSRHFDGLILKLTEREPSMSERHFDVTLSGRAYGGRALPGKMSIPAQTGELVANLCRDIDRVLRRGGNDWSAWEFAMQGLSADLASRILPMSIQDALLQSRWKDGTPLHIESDDAWIPWEALFLGVPTGTRSGESGFFLGEKFAVTRWLRLGRAREQVGGSSVVLVAPTNSNLSVDKERAVLREVTGHAPIDLSVVLDVQRCFLGKPRAQVLHFACHGQSKADAVIAETLVLQDGELHSTDVPLPRPGQTGALDGALVFLNACQAGIEQRGLWGHSGWASKLLDAGAGAVIAPSWTVTDSGAKGFAEQFYRHAKSGMSLAEAVRRARRDIVHTGNLDRIGYALYAAPTAQVCFDAQAADYPEPLATPGADGER